MYTLENDYLQFYLLLDTSRMDESHQMFLETAYKKLEDISGIISFLYIAAVMESSLFLRKTITLYTVQRQTFFS